MTGARRSRWLPWLHLPLALVGLTMLVPLVFMFRTALGAPGDLPPIEGGPFDMLVPSERNWSNFVEVWRVVPFGRYYANSLIVAIVVTTAKVATSAMAAFAFARLRFPGRDVLFLAYLATMMVPGAVTMIPNFITIRLLPEWLEVLVPWVDWISLRHLGATVEAPLVGRLVGLDSFFALIAPGMFTAYGTFMLRQFFLTLPRELDEAGRIDGCTHWQVFTRICLPLSIPALTTLVIFTFMGTWGAFIWPLVVTNQDGLRTLPLGLQAFQGQYGTEWHLMMAAALMMLVPQIVIFLLGQRFFLSGLTIGAVKG
jgi:multiple sugar transport system permease protein